MTISPTAYPGSPPSSDLPGAVVGVTAAGVINQAIVRFSSLLPVYLAGRLSKAAGTLLLRYCVSGSLESVEFKKANVIMYCDVLVCWARNTPPRDDVPEALVVATTFRIQMR